MFKAAFTKMQFNVLDKKNQEKVVVTRICFYGSAKTEGKIKSVYDGKQGLCCQDDQNKL